MKVIFGLNTGKQYALSLFCFFFVVTLLSTSFVIPNIERTLQSQKSIDATTALLTTCLGIHAPAKLQANNRSFERTEMHAS